jgi:hypothetical protein
MCASGGRRTFRPSAGMPHRTRSFYSFKDSKCILTPLRRSKRRSARRSSRACPTPSGRSAPSAFVAHPLLHIHTLKFTLTGADHLADRELRLAGRVPGPAHRAHRAPLDQLARGRARRDGRLHRVHQGGPSGGPDPARPAAAAPRPPRHPRGRGRASPLPSRGAPADGARRTTRR